MEDLSSLTDAEIVKRGIENPDNFLYIIQRYQDKIMRYIKRRTKVSNTMADDVAQEIFIKVYKNLNAYNSDMSFSSWIYRIAHNHIIDWYRKEKKHEYISMDDTESGTLYSLAGEENSDKNSLTQEIKNEIGEIVNSLPQDYKEVIILRFFEEKTYEEISDIMKIPVNSVGVYISRAKNTMKKKLLDKKFI